MNEQDMVHAYSGILFSPIKEGNSAGNATAWMNFEDVMLSEISQSRKVKVLYDCTSMRNLEPIHRDKI